MPNTHQPSAHPFATPVDRRTFVKAASAAGLGLAVAPSGLAAQAPVSGRRRYAIVGLGSRHAMYRSAILGTHAPHAELVGLCDINPGRVALSQKTAAGRGVTVPGYAASDFEKMIRETKPHYVIVTTVDATHDDYIVRALEAYDRLDVGRLGKQVEGFDFVQVIPGNDQALDFFHVGHGCLL